VDSAEALGGAERSLLLLLKYLDRARYRPVLACNAGPLADAARALDIPVRTMPMPRIRGRPVGLWHLARGAVHLAGLIHRERAVLVHSNIMRASFYAAAAAALTRRPLLWHVRDIHPRRERWYLHLMCQLCRRAVAISHAVAAQLPCQAKLQVVYNGVELAPFTVPVDVERIRLDLGLPRAGLVVGNVGRVAPWKGQAAFLRAMARVAQAQPTVWFAVVGDTIFDLGRDYLGELKGLAAGLGLQERVVFTGYRADLPRVYAALDVVVHCADAEPFGRTIVEAMAAGKPLVAYADGGVPELVVDGQTGLLVPPGDEAGLAAATLALLNASERRYGFGAAGRQRVAERFDPARVARQLEAIYEHTLRVTCNLTPDAGRNT
jgi:glycosyltransferase involved in cell wall biosynthesis